MLYSCSVSCAFLTDSGVRFWRSGEVFQQAGIRGKVIAAWSDLLDPGVRQGFCKGFVRGLIAILPDFCKTLLPGVLYTRIRVLSGGILVFGVRGLWGVLGFEGLGL